MVPLAALSPAMVFVPGISKRKRILEKRKGGGGGGHGGEGGGEGGGGAKGGSGGESGGEGGSISSGASSKPISSTSAGGGPKTTIPQGQAFSGRAEGGGMRNQIYGNSVYGSGYPGVATAAGVAGLGFPFYFWPVVWGSATVVGTGAFLHANGEYGDVNNSSRPGGPLMTAAFPSSSNNNITFRIMSDNATVTSLISDIVTSCGTSISSPSNISSATYNDSGPPLPGQAVQYYRASSVVLSLDSYNNSAAFSNDTNTPPSPLPSNTDTILLTCLNQTIGDNVPLVDGAHGLRWSSPSGIGLVALVLTISRLISIV